MNTSVTMWLAVFLLLCVLTMLPVHFHLAATRDGGASSKAPRARSGNLRPCPQCGQATSSDSAFCEKCGVPLMLWKLKLARSVQGGRDVKGNHPVPIVHQNRCIRCGSCVNACDRKVLEIVARKSAVTRIEACTGKSVCAEVCPTGACELTGSGAARRLEVPQIDSNFETNQEGIYAIGELGGMGLIKNAVNEGQLVIEKLKAHHTAREGVLDLAIVGASPAGLSASLAAKAAGLNAVVLEQGAFADTIRRFPNRKIVMAEPLRVPLYGSLWISNAPKEALLGVWQTIVESAKLQIKENEQVVAVRRSLRLENDYVFAMLGGSSPKAFLESIGVAMVTKEVREDSEAKIPA